MIFKTILLPMVSFIKVKKHGLKESVFKALELSGFDELRLKDRVFLKINAMSDQFIPGVCTNPLVLDYFLEYFRDSHPDKEVLVGDANIATMKQFDKAVREWGYDQVCEKHGAKLVNLSDQPKTVVDYGGKIFKKVMVPEVLLGPDLITLPVMKTHCITGLTASLKNQWGCLTEVRQQYHKAAHQAIPEINDLLKPKFSLVDGTISMEGNGPRNGKLKLVNALFAGKDLVAVDTAVSDFMGFKEKPEKLRVAEKIGLGSMDYELVGDDFYVADYEKPELGSHIIFKTEFFFRNLPVTKWLFFKTPLFKFFSKIVSIYNTKLWWWLSGKKQKEKIMSDPDYKELYSTQRSRLSSRN